MNRLILRSITASALFLGLLLPSAEVTAQTTKKDLVGAWTLVSITLEREGKKTDFYGPDPQGQATYEANGRLSVIITRSDLPPFASKNRELGTPEENKAVVQGSIAYFGSYSVNEADKTITFHIERPFLPELERDRLCGIVRHFRSIASCTSQALRLRLARDPINRCGSVPGRR